MPARFVDEKIRADQAHRIFARRPRQIRRDLQINPATRRGWELRPVREDLLGLFHLCICARKIDPQLSRPSSDFNLDRCQAVPFHSAMELFVSFFDPVVLEAIHG